MALLAVDGAGIAANTALSSLYSPQRAVADYFAAQSRGSVSGMMSNATFLQGSDPAFFSSSAVTAMMALPQNRDVKDIRIISTQSTDYSTETVNVSMMWGGTPRRQAYTVRKDNSRVHELIYHSWRVDIPFATTELLRYLCDASPSWDAVVPATDAGPEPLCAVYGPACLEPVQTVLAMGERKMTAFWGAVRVRTPARADLSAFGDPERLFRNLNHPSDYAAVGEGRPR